MYEVDIVDFNTEIICTYASLDYLIKKCKFTEKQIKILELYQSGFTENDIAITLETSQSNINKILNTCVKKIKEQSKNDWQYEFLFWNKKKTNENWKKCSKCNEWKRESDFYKEEKGKNGLRSECKRCFGKNSG